MELVTQRHEVKKIVESSCLSVTSFSVSKVEHQLFCTGSAKTLTKNGDWLVYYVVATKNKLNIMNYHSAEWH